MACHHLPGALLVAAAACITTGSLAAVTRLPRAPGRERRIVLQRAQAGAIGAMPLLQLLRLAGARPTEVGTSVACAADELAAMLACGAAAGLCRHDGRPASDLVDLPGFVWACRRAGVPALVLCEGAVSPLAALDAGADLVLLDPAACYGGEAAGLVLGDAERVGWCRLQKRGPGALFDVAPARLEAVLAAVERAAGDLAAGLALADHWPDAERA